MGSGKKSGVRGGSLKGLDIYGRRHVRRTDELAKQEETRGGMNI